MSAGLRIAFFGSSLVSAYWNGAATYYRGLIRALADRQHHVTFYEPDAFGRQQHRDIADPPWAEVVVYPADEASVIDRLMAEARDSDVIVKASGVGVFDAELEAAVASLRGAGRLIVFWDVDAPATLDRLDADPTDPFRALVPSYDLILTYGGGAPVTDAYTAFGAKTCVPIYNALDPGTHHPVPADARFECDLAFIGNRLPDREDRVDEFFLRAASALPARQFLLGGSGWHDRAIPANVRYVGHVYTKDHNAVNATALSVLNITRNSMARMGFSPPTRLFEAAGAGGCLITDAWDGIEQFLEPGREVLVAESGEAVAALVAGLSRHRARAVGEAARTRLLAEHTYAHRAEQVEAVLLGRRHPHLGVAS
jgi:spore maturation protein CgeB